MTPIPLTTTEIMGTASELLSAFGFAVLFTVLVGVGLAIRLGRGMKSIAR